MPNPLDELGDFGLVTPSQGTNAADQLGGLEELLGSDLLSEAQKSKALTQQIQELEQQEPTGFLGRLLEPGVLLSLLGGGVAAAAGQPGAGLGLGIGGLQRHQLLGAIEEHQREKGIEELEAKRDAADEKVDKMRGRIERMLIANPDLFISPGGEVPDPDVLGYLVTGADLPVFPQTRRIANRREKQWEAKLEFLGGALEQAATPEAGREIVSEMLSMLDWADAPPSIVEHLYNSLGTREWDTAWGSTLLRYGGPSALDAIKTAAENGWALQDPRTLKLISFTGDDALQPSQMLNLKFIGLIDELNEWMKASPEQAASIQESADSKSEELRLMAEVAFAGRPGDQAFFLDKANIPAGLDLGTILRAYGMADKNLNLVNVIAQANQIESLKDLTPEELQNYKMNTGLSILEGAVSVAGERTAKQMAALRNRKMIELESLLPQANDATLRTILNIVMEGARERAKKSDDGSIDVADWERHIDLLLPPMVEAYQKGQPSPQ